jgi:hypothetical protein
MAVAFAHYTRFKTLEGEYVSGRDYQNFFVGETRSHNGNSYSFAPFTIVGLSSSRNGDVAQASLVSVPNAITSPLFHEVIISFWLIEITTVAINMNEDQTFTEGIDIALELWSCTAGTVDTNRITITLSSPLNAAQREIPGRVLTRSMVGSIPPTGQIVIA